MRVKPHPSGRGRKARTPKVSSSMIHTSKDLPADSREVTPAEIRVAQQGTRPRNPPKRISCEAGAGAVGIPRLQAGEDVNWRARLAQVDPRQFVPFATQALHEWLSDRCQACGGTGKLERTRGGAWVRPRGAMQRNAVFRVCTACDGSRREPPRHAERRRRLGLTATVYEEQAWPAHFRAALDWLSHSLAPRVRRPLARELERRSSS